MRKILFIIIALLLLNTCNLFNSNDNDKVSVALQVTTESRAFNISDIDSINLHISAPDMDDISKTFITNSISVEVPQGDDRLFNLSIIMTDGREFQGSTIIDVKNDTQVVNISVTLVSGKEIISFSTKNPIASGVISGTDIVLSVPNGTDLTAIEPTIIHTGASISPESGIITDFTNPVIYTVTAKNGSTSKYTVTVTEKSDIIPPVAGNSGIITTSSILDTSITLNWTVASDNLSTIGTLKYLVYYSTTNNIDTVANIEANGTAVGVFSTNIITKVVSGLSGNTSYYFNIIVQDEAGNKTSYSTVNETTIARQLVFVQTQTQGSTSTNSSTWIRSDYSDDYFIGPKDATSLYFTIYTSDGSEINFETISLVDLGNWHAGGIEYYAYKDGTQTGSEIDSNALPGLPPALVHTFSDPAFADADKICINISVSDTTNKLQIFEMSVNGTIIDFNTGVTGNGSDTLTVNFPVP